MSGASKFRVAALVAAGMFVASGLQAQGIKLRVGDSFPANHYIAENATKPWMENIRKITGGKVEFEYYPSEQLGKAKDLLSLTQTGAIDIGYVAPAFVTDKLPLTVVGELPLNFTKSCEATAALWAVAKEGGVLDKAEFAPNKVKVLWSMVLPPYQLYMAKDNIAALDVVKGRKIRTSGAAKVLALRKLGAVPVSIPSPEMREALHRGTVDGMLLPHNSVASYGLSTGFKYATVGHNFGSFVVTYLISRDKWNSFPEDVRKAFDQAGEEVMKSICKYTDDAEAKDVEALKKDGVNFISLNPAEAAKLKEIMDGVSDEWAKLLDGRNRPGTEVLKAFQAALGK